MKVYHLVHHCVNLSELILLLSPLLNNLIEHYSADSVYALTIPDISHDK
jgi:hypothetical protein